MTGKRKFLRIFWRCLLYLTLLSGAAGVIAVLIDYLVFEGITFSTMQIVQFVILIGISAVIKYLIIPKFPIDKGETLKKVDRHDKKNKNHSV